MLFIDITFKAVLLETLLGSFQYLCYFLTFKLKVLNANDYL